MNNDAVSPLAASTPDAVKPDISFRLDQLLNDMPRQRCIDRVSEHLGSIREARHRKITWDAIAESLCMNRGTLINAVKSLTAQSSATAHRTGAKLTLPIITPNAISPLPKHAYSEPELPHDLPTQGSSISSTAQMTQTSHVAGITIAAGITILGKTRIEKFNL